MQNTQTTAGETAQTKPVWGIVSLIGLLVATTISGSLIITAVAVAMFGIGAWRGGYMDTSTGSVSRQNANTAVAGERRAA